jgi:Lon protease-like protein
MEVPLFPLNTVLFPGGPLPLRIFESRYLDMVSRCMKDDAPFGVVLIREGAEVGPASTCDVGTLARIVDWYQGSDGILGITAIGTDRFRLRSSARQDDGLNIGEVDSIPPPSPVSLPDVHRDLPQILLTILDDLGRLYENVERLPDDAAWVAWRFVEILPIDLMQKQQVLESDDVLATLDLVERVLHSQG